MNKKWEIKEVKVINSEWEPYPFPIYFKKELFQLEKIAWKDIRFEIMSDDSVRIVIPNRKYSERFTYSEFGFKDRRKGDLPNKLWGLLILLSENNGLLNDLSFLTRGKLEKDISRLRGHLKFMMGKSDNPIIFNKRDTSYQTVFLIRDKRGNAQKFGLDVDI